MMGAVFSAGQCWLHELVFKLQYMYCFMVGLASSCAVGLLRLCLQCMGQILLVHCLADSNLLGCVAVRHIQGDTLRTMHAVAAGGDKTAWSGASSHQMKSRHFLTG